MTRWLRIGRGLAIAVTLTGAGAGSAVALGTSEQRSACTPDVFRLCSAEIPRVDQIIACLKKSKPNLSPTCRAALDAKG